MSRQPVVFTLGFRSFYLLAAAFAVVAILGWLGWYAGQLAFGGPLTGVLWHSHEMAFGFVAAVLAGFLFTAVRNWTGMPTPAGAALAAITFLWLLARVMLVTGPALPAVLLDVAFLPVVTLAIALPIIRSGNGRNYKVVAIMAALSVIHVLYHAAGPDEVPSGYSRHLLFLFFDVFVILFALIGGRVIPAFTRNAVPGSDPRHEPWLEWVAFGALLVLATAGLFGPTLPDLGWFPALLFAVITASQLLRLALWQPQRTLGKPLLWMMAVAYSWLPFAFLLRLVALFDGVMPGAWIHALTAGAFSSLMMAMMMRSTLGHTGRPLKASGVDVAAFLLLQAAAMTRVLAGIIGEYRTVVIVAGLLWVCAFGLFLVRYLPMLMQPRADGKPG